MGDDVALLPTDANIGAVLPSVAPDSRKGDNGRLIVFGGCPKYTGAPYLAATAAIYSGCDYGVVITNSVASEVHSYGPDLVVADYGSEDVARRGSAVLVGVGLGTDPTALEMFSSATSAARRLQVPLVVDGDGIRALCATLTVEQLSVLAHEIPVVLTPNIAETAALGRWVGLSALYTDRAEQKAFFERTGAYVIYKGRADVVVGGEVTVVASPGSSKRCSGIGDVLAGVVASVIGRSGPCGLAVACHMVRSASRRAWERRRWALCSSDVLEELGTLVSEF